MEAGLKRRVPRCPDSDPEAGKPTCEALFCSHPLLQLSFTFYVTSQSGIASERYTVVTGGDNPMDFQLRVLVSSAFHVDTERMSLSPISMFQFTLLLALHITYVQFLEVLCILHHFYK